MRIKIIATIFICFCSVRGISQFKIPVYVIGSKNLNLDSSNNIQVFQFFSDSTFSLVNYHSIRYNIFKSETRGRYLKNGDTLFLNDASSFFFPFIKEKNPYKELSKDERMQLYPARIIMQFLKSEYTSYLNIPQKIYTNTYLAVVELDKMYKIKQKHYEETRHIQF
jgi:hypothetical protein